MNQRLVDVGVGRGIALAMDAGQSWVEVRSEHWEKMQVGKKYNFGGEVGRVLKKSSGYVGGTASGHGTGGSGLPMVLVAWD